MSPLDGISDERIEQARRLNWTIGWEMFDPENRPQHIDIFKRWHTPKLYWEAVTPAVKQMSLDRLDYIDGDDGALDRDPERNATEDDWAAHRAFIEESHA